MIHNQAVVKRGIKQLLSLPWCFSFPREGELMIL